MMNMPVINAERAKVRRCERAVVETAAEDLSMASIVILRRVEGWRSGGYSGSVATGKLGEPVTQVTRGIADQQRGEFAKRSVYEPIFAGQASMFGKLG
jgi:hypothetical protein